MNTDPYDLPVSVDEQVSLVTERASESDLEEMDPFGAVADAVDHLEENITLSPAQRVATVDIALANHSVSRTATDHWVEDAALNPESLSGGLWRGVLQEIALANIGDGARDDPIEGWQEPVYRPSLNPGNVFTVIVRAVIGETVQSPSRDTRAVATDLMMDGFLPLLKGLPLAHQMALVDHVWEQHDVETAVESDLFSKHNVPTGGEAIEYVIGSLVYHAVLQGASQRAEDILESMGVE